MRCIHRIKKEGYGYYICSKYSHGVICTGSSLCPSFVAIENGEIVETNDPFIKEEEMRL